MNDGVAALMVWPSDGMPFRPMPRNDRPASAATKAGRLNEIDTTMGATMFGSSSLNRICRVGTPITRAACTNSRSRSESTSPRISRARVIQPKSVRTHTPS